MELRPAVWTGCSTCCVRRWQSRSSSSSRPSPCTRIPHGPADCARIAREVWPWHSRRRCGTSIHFPVIGGRARSAFEFQGFGFAPTGCCSASTPPITTRASGWSRGPSAGAICRLEAHRLHLVPQRAGDARHDQRCPGEAITLELLRHALGMLTAGLPTPYPSRI